MEPSVPLRQAGVRGVYIRECVRVCACVCGSVPVGARPRPRPAAANHPAAALMSQPLAAAPPLSHIGTGRSVLLPAVATVSRCSRGNFSGLREKEKEKEKERD